MTKEAEIAVIGSCLADESAGAFALSVMLPEYFESVEGEKSFRLIKATQEAGRGVDVVTVIAESKDNDTRTFLLDCAEKVPTSLNIEHYCNIVKISYHKKKLIELFKQAAEDPQNQTIHEKINSAINEMTESKIKIKNTTTDLMVYSDILEKRSRGEHDAVLSGYGTFDHITCGFQKGDMVVFGARTSKGKSSALINLANRYLDRGRRVLYISSEMTYIQLLDRLISLKSRVPIMNIRWNIKPDDMRKIVSSLGELNGKPLLTYEGGFLNLHKIKSLIGSHRPDVVIVDYLQGFIPQGKVDSRAAFYSTIAYSLKAMAIEKNVTVICASQLNRNVEHANREPVLADFKESGGIEEAVDVGVLMHQESENHVSPKLYQWIVAKNRNGACGKVPFAFFEQFTRFEEREETENG